MKRKILTALGALSLVFCMFTTQGCFDGPGWGYPGYGYGGGYPTYSYGSWYGPAYVGHPVGYGGWAHDGRDHDGWGHEGFEGGHGDAAGHGGGGGGHVFAHSAHGGGSHRG